MDMNIWRFVLGEIIEQRWRIFPSDYRKLNHHLLVLHISAASPFLKQHFKGHLTNNLKLFTREELECFLDC